MSYKLSKIAINAILFITLVHSESFATSMHEQSKESRTIPLLKALGVEDKPTTVLVSFFNPLSYSEKEYFFEMGVDTIVYAGDLNYYFYLPESVALQLHNEKNVKAVHRADPSQKMHLYDGSLTTLSDEDVIDANILFLKEMAYSDVENYFNANDISAQILKVTPELRSAKVHLRIADFKKLAKLPLVQYLDKAQQLLLPKSVPALETRNSKTAKATHVKELWTAPYNLNGRNIAVGVVDGGAIRATHQEFGDRVHIRTTADVNFHATHVAGSIGAKGVNKDAHGMANEVDIYSYYFGDDAFSEAVLNMYRNDGVLISNHSYGYSLKEHLGDYDSVAATQDITVKNNPYLNIFEAAGNDGVDPNYPEYGMIKGPGNSKNILTIGALNTMSNNVAKLSSTGPVKDGRIKPDLCVRGEYVTSPSSDSDTSYAMMSGTSMASPAAAGIGALVAQEYKRVTGGYDIRHDTLKAVLVNTAEDIGNPGPDYKAGFGMINAKAAVDTVKSIGTQNPMVTLSFVRHGHENKYSFVLSEKRNFKTTIVWIDPEADPSGNVTLVNDIDIALVNKKTNQIYYPYTLDKDNPSRVAAQNKPNHVDNIEQIEVKNLPAGEYELVVKGTKIITDTQEYTLVSNLPLFAQSNVETLRPSKIQNFARTMFMATF